MIIFALALVLTAPPIETADAAAIRDGVRDYRKWGRVDERPAAAPGLCRAPIPGLDDAAPATVRRSAAGPHGKKLYYLWASEKWRYLMVGTPKQAKYAALPVGFTVVKESFAAEPLDPHRVHAEQPPLAYLPMRVPDPIDTLTLPSGETFQTGAPIGLFVMRKVANRARAGTDEGWIYGTVAPDGSITSAGRVASCMSCHEHVHDRLFGLSR